MDPSIVNMIMFVFFLAIFYFFFMRPSIQKQKAQDEFMNALSKGDQVVTSSGILGKITKIEDNGIVELQIDNKSFIRVIKSAISQENTNAVYTTKKDS